MTSLVARQRLPLEARVIAFGGGGGGVGRSTIAREIGANLARRGRRTLLVDAAIFQPSLALLLHKSPPSAPPDQELDAPPLDLAPFIVSGARDQASLLSLRHLRRGPAFPLQLRALELMNALRALDFDEILIDLDGRNDGFNASLMALSDVPILISSAEATSLYAAAESLRQFVVFALLLQPEASAVEHRLMRALEALPAEFSVSDLHDAFEHGDVRELLVHVLHSAQPWILLNRTLDSSERELAQAIALGFSAMTGVRPRVLGTLGVDHQRSQHLRHDRLDEPLRSEGDDLSVVAQRLLSLPQTLREQPRVSAALMRHPTDLIGVGEDLPPREIRLAWRHLWDGLRRESPFTRSVLPARERELLMLQLEEASQRLQTWLQTREVRETLTALPRVNHSVVGKKLQQARADAGISIRDLSLRSRIGLRYLEAIESFEIEALPREVYLRGYLREVARALGLDPEALVEDYLAELLETRARLLQQDRAPSNPE